MIKQIIWFVGTVLLLFATGLFLIRNPYLDIMGQLNRPTLKITEFNRQIGSLVFTTSPIFKVMINNKTLIQEGFLSCYKALKSIDANGDSFYKVKTSLTRQCHKQLVQKIDDTYNSVEVSGTFEDCEDVHFQSAFYSKGDELHLDFKCQTQDEMDATIWLYSQDNEIFSGLGYQFSHLKLYDRPYSLLVRYKGVGRGDQPISFLSELAYGKSGTYYSSYSPIPIWYSVSRKLAYFTDNPTYLIWWNNRVLAWYSAINIRIITKDTMLYLLQAVFNIHGHTAPTPDWVNQGAILGLQGGCEGVLYKYKKLKKSAIGGLWLQDWVGKRMSLGYSRLWWNWEIDQQKYRYWTAMRESLEKDGVSLLIYINPMLTNVTNKASYIHDFFGEAVEKYYLVKQPNGSVFLTSAFSDFQAGLIDLYNTQARSFYKSIIKKALTSTGARGMMTDFGEAYPLMYPLEFSVKKHNQYPVEWLQLVHETLLEHLGGRNDFFTFSRAGYWGSPRHTRSLWAGDQNMNYGRHNGIPSCLVAMLSSGLSGYLNTHCDIGGYVHINVWFWYLANRDQIQMERWLQLAAFSPIFRSHYGNRPERTIHVYSDEVVQSFEFWSKMYRLLAPYRKEQKHNLPLVRPLFLHHNSEEVYDIWDQYYLGDWLLVAPLLSSSYHRFVYIPYGTWIDIWTGKPHEGCTKCTIKMDSKGLPVVLMNEMYENRVVLLYNIRQLKYKSMAAEASSEL